MGEEAKQEEVKVEETKPADEKKEEAKPSPPEPIILSMDLHCAGCAKKIKKCIMKCQGVEEVETDMGQNKVTVKGIVDPQALCSRIQKKTMRSAKLLSPLPAPDAAESQPAATDQASGMTTVELQVNMHCEACAQQLRRKILRTKGVKEAETDFSGGKVKVTGTMTSERLVVDIYRRTGKLATVIPPPPPPPSPPKEEEKKEEAEKPAEEKPAEEKKEEKAEEKKEEEKAPEQPEGDKGGDAKEEKAGDGEEAKKEAEPAGPAFIGPEDIMMKRMMYWNNAYEEEEMAKRMMLPPPWMNMPVYVIQPPPPPPQFFSDENPNACVIS